MSSFIRYAALAAVVLSLGLLVTALPTLLLNITIPTVTGTDDCSLAVGKLAVEIQAVIKALAECKTILDVEVNVKACVELLLACRDDLLKIGAGVAVTADAQASIVVCFVAIISAIVRVCMHLSLQLGVEAIVTVCASLDTALQVCLESLNVCVDGMVTLIGEKILVADVQLIIQLGLKVCASVLGLNVAAL